MELNKILMVGLNLDECVCNQGISISRLLKKTTYNLKGPNFFFGDFVDWLEMDYSSMAINYDLIIEKKKGHICFKN